MIEIPRWPRLHHRVLESTMDEAERQARTRPDEAFWIVADHQSRGRGREGRQWLTNPGDALLATLVLRRGGRWDPGDPISGTLALRTAAILLQVLGELSPSSRPAVKWPNDILVEGRKLCGILIEADRETFRVGIGLNLRPTAVADSVSLIELDPTRRDATPSMVLDLIEVNAAAMLHGDGWYPLVARHLAWRGRPVRVEQGSNPVRGLLDGIDRDGALLIRESNRSLVRVVSGTLRHESS